MNPMKFFSIVISMSAIVGFFACGNNVGEAYYDSNNQFSDLVKDLNEQFSENAGYQSIMISYDEIMGNTILVKVSRDINKNKIEEWFYMNGAWDKKADTTLQLENKSPSDFLFSLKNDYDISKLVDLVKNSKNRVKDELKVNEVVCKSVNLLMRNKRVSENKMDDLITQITIEPLEGGISYNLSYDAEGNLKDMTK
ncbi:MAG: hypothetical protein P1P88_08835 [Bacteroidales bacterium]|nr:hypothetical protein [Bacteroidales bacterium]